MKCFFIVALGAFAMATFCSAQEGSSDAPNLDEEELQDPKDDAQRILDEEGMRRAVIERNYMYAPATPIRVRRADVRHKQLKFNLNPLKTCVIIDLILFPSPTFDDRTSITMMG